MLRVTLYDLVTKKIAVYPNTDLDAWAWTEGNWSCDCNRAIAFPGVEGELEDTFGEFTCNGKDRLIVINATGDDLNTYDSRTEFIDACNDGYAIPEDFTYPVYSDLTIAEILAECKCSCHKTEPKHLHGTEPCCGFSSMNGEQAKEALHESGQYVVPEVMQLSEAAFDQLVDAIENPKPMSDEVKARWASAVENGKSFEMQTTPSDDAIVSLMLDDIDAMSNEELVDKLLEHADGPVGYAITGMEEANKDSDGE